MTGGELRAVRNLSKWRARTLSATRPVVLFSYKFNTKINTGHRDDVPYEPVIFIICGENLLMWRWRGKLRPVRNQLMQKKKAGFPQLFLYHTDALFYKCHLSDFFSAICYYFVEIHTR